MPDKKDDATIGFPLCFPGHRFGVSCGADGPSLGLYPLLIKTGKGLVPRPESELQAALSSIYGKPFSGARLVQGLGAAARALNDGHIARAMFATQHLRLQSLTIDQASRAAEMAKRDAVKKASPDDEKHPGWPKRSPGGVGGEFRPKDGAAAGEGEKKRWRNVKPGRRPAISWSRKPKRRWPVARCGVCSERRQALGAYSA